MGECATIFFIRNLYMYHAVYVNPVSHLVAIAERLWSLNFSSSTHLAYQNFSILISEY